MPQLEASDPTAEPGAAERDRRIDRQKILVLFVERREGIRHAGETAGDRGQKASPRVRKTHPALFADEERFAHPFFQLADLVADRGLGHPEFVRRTREILMPAGRLEGADGGQGRQASHRLCISSTYSVCQSFCWPG